MSFQKFLSSITAFIVIAACSHSVSRDPAGVELSGLETPALRKKIDAVFQNNGVLESLASKGPAVKKDAKTGPVKNPAKEDAPKSSGADRSKEDVETGIVLDRHYEGSTLQWRTKVNASAENDVITRMISTKNPTPARRADEGRYITQVTGLSAGGHSAVLSQLHLSPTGELDFFTRCLLAKGATKLSCITVNEDSCWTLLKNKILAQRPTKQVDWKAQACGIRNSFDAFLSNGVEDAEKWAQSALTQSEDIEGVGSSHHLFGEDLKNTFKGVDAKATTDLAPLKAGIKKLDCDVVVEVRTSEEEFISSYIQTLQPLAGECQRLAGIFPNLGKGQATASEKKSENPKRRSRPSRQRPHWRWQR